MESSSVLIIIEMISIVFALIATASFLNGKESVILAEAGPMDNADPNKLHIKTPKQRRAYILDDNDNVVNTRSMKRIKVVGKCLEKRGIHDGAQYYVQPIPEKADWNSVIKNGDVLLIYYPPKDIFKVRVFEKFADMLIR